MKNRAVIAGTTRWETQTGGPMFHSASMMVQSTPDVENSEHADPSYQSPAFTLDRRQLAAHHSTGLVATNAVASPAATNSRARKFVEALWNVPAPSGRGRYYDGMLQLLALLHCGGESQVWTPQ